MSVQEVMQLVEKDSILSTLLIALFIFLISCLLFLYIVFPTITDKYAYPRKNPWKIAFIVVTALAFFTLCGIFEGVRLQGRVESKIDKAVIAKKVTRYTIWNQDENGDYYFGKHRVTKGDISVMKHQTKLSKPYAKVTTKYISKRFSKKQKAKIHRSLSERANNELKSTAVIHK